MTLIFPRAKVFFKISEIVDFSAEIIDIFNWLLECIKLISLAGAGSLKNLTLTCFSLGRIMALRYGKIVIPNPASAR